MKRTGAVGYSTPGGCTSVVGRTSPRPSEAGTRRTERNQGKRVVSEAGGSQKSQAEKCSEKRCTALASPEASAS